MPLNFENSQEIRLKSPPLEEVICQVRYPPILKISRDIPIDFQDSIRDRFPIFEIQQGVILPMAVISPEEHSPIPSSVPKLYNFLTDDRKTLAALSNDFIALSTKAYTHWDDFVRDLEKVSSTFVRFYQPQNATRIGLRFVNKFTIKNTKSKSFKEVLSLLRSELTCLVSTDAWAEPEELLTQIVLEDGRAKLALRIGSGRDENEQFFVLDLDYYLEDTIEITNLYNSLNVFHTRLYDAFRWCVKEDALPRFEKEVV